MRGRGITLLVPFRAAGPERTLLWEWLEVYWRAQLPRAQIVMGHNANVPFSKTAAVNAAERYACGDILVILDADAYITAELIEHCASEIRRARRRGRRLWFIPYRRFYRLSHATTLRVLSSDPRRPWHPDDPPAQALLDSRQVNSNYGHHYAAMIMVMPREAFEMTGGMDERFTGWGGEDISFMRAVDTVYSNHKTVDRSVFHLYHETIGQGIHRQWTGQTKRMPFALLGARYLAAYGDRARMLRLNAEWQKPTKEQPWTTAGIERSTRST